MYNLINSDSHLFCLIPKHSFMIPNFEKSGLLPVGIHFAIWNDFEKSFVTNQQRLNLLEGLRKALKLLYSFGCKEIYIGGSFITDKPEPEDIDVCYDNTGIEWNAFLKQHPEFRPTKYGNKQQKKKYGCEFFAINAFEYNMVQFFQFDKDGNQKGIIKIRLTGQL